ncbi:MAG TPA: diphthine--ammonia ligase [Hanamia sp.]
MKEKVIFNWSGGKDSSLCLYKILQQNNYDIICLLTSVSEAYQRVSMHGVRLDLLEAQTENIGIPLVKMYIPEMPTMAVYEKVMTSTLGNLKVKGATASVFGDIFLEDLRKYRENQLARIDLKGIFPLWKIDSKKLIHEFIDLGFKAIITCVNDNYLDKSFAGRVIDNEFLKDLPSNVDPCGENGEFHSFVFEGPIFKKAIKIKKGEIVYKKYTSPNTDETDKDKNPFSNGFWYCDLLLS